MKIPVSIILLLAAVTEHVEVESAAFDELHRSDPTLSAALRYRALRLSRRTSESQYSIERNDGTWDDPTDQTGTAKKEGNSPERNDRPSGQSGGDTGSRSPGRNDRSQNQSQGRGEGDSRSVSNRNDSPASQFGDKTDSTISSSRNRSLSGQEGDRRGSSYSPSSNNNRSGQASATRGASPSSNRNGSRSESSGGGARTLQTSARNNNESGQSRGVRNSSQSPGRNNGSVRLPVDQGGTALSSGRNDGSLGRPVGQGGASTASRNQNRTTRLTDGEESDGDDLEARRLSGAAKRFINSSSKLVEGVLPGNLGKHLLPKVEDDSNDQVCYDHVGCFTNRDLFTLPSSFPIDPEKVNTQFLLFSRSNRKNPIAIENKGSSRDGRVNQFRQPKPLKVLVHGFNEDGNVSWAQDIKDALLDEEHCNVIIVDWKGGANKVNYIKAAGNTALVGRQISLLLQRLIKSHQGALRPADIHLIGFSLGAQVAGFAGRHFQKDTRSVIGRITALDAAGPLFDETEVSVSRKDADYVDAIHTSGGEKILKGQLGIDNPVAHVDFYPNGGKKQPGCPPLDLNCDHNRAHEFFLESIKNKRCRFVSSPCQGGYSAFLENKCVQRGERGEMGYYSPRARGRGIQVLTTNAKSEYCVGNA